MTSQTSIITVVFPDNQVKNFEDDKKARKALRSAELSVTNFVKLGNIWALTEETARATAAVLKVNPDLLKVTEGHKKTTTERKAERAARREAAQAEKPVAVHSETYRGSDIVVAKVGAFYVPSYSELSGSHTYSGGQLGSLPEAISHVHSLVDIMLQ